MDTHCVVMRHATKQSCVFVKSTWLHHILGIPHDLIWCIRWHKLHMLAKIFSIYSSLKHAYLYFMRVKCIPVSYTLTGKKVIKLTTHLNNPNNMSSKSYNSSNVYIQMCNTTKLLRSMQYNKVACLTHVSYFKHYMGFIPL